MKHQDILSFIEINAYTRFTFFLRLVVEGLCRRKVRCGFEVGSEIADEIFVYGFIREVRAGGVGVLQILCDRLPAYVDIGGIAEILDDLQLVVRTGIKGDLLAVADDVDALQVLAVRQTAHILSLSRQRDRLHALYAQRADREIELEESVVAAVDLEFLLVHRRGGACLFVGFADLRLRFLVGFLLG